MIFEMGLLKFGLLCIDFLAWPMLALAYPLCASIRAIETGSKYHMRKLVTYWTVLSLISLFEHTLRVMEWVPFWPYIKLIATFWLVIPRFNGACYAYDRLVRADLGEKLLCILSHFSPAFHAHKQLSEDIKAMEQTTEQETEERKSIYIKAMEQRTEQGTEDEERKSIYIKAIEQTTEQGNEDKKVKSEVDNIGEIQKKEIPMPKTSEEKIIPKTNSSKLIIQREWTCAVCQVTCTSEHDLKSHLGGNRHRTNCAELKSIKRVTKDTGPSSSSSSSPKATNLPNQLKNEPANNVGVREDSRLYCRICSIWCSDEGSLASHVKGRKHTKLEKMPIFMAKERAKHTPSGGGSKEESNVKPEKATKKPPEKNYGKQEKENNASVSTTDSTVYCGLCNIKAPNEASLVAHLKGKKHLSKLKQMGIMMG